MYFGRLTQSGTNPYEESRTASQIIKHPLFNYPIPDNNIALVQLSSSVTFSDYIRPVRLAAAGSVFAAGTESWVTGWGLLQPEGPPSNILQEVMIPIVSNSECAKVYEGVTSITSNMICAGQEGKSICPGDSGGPMVSRKGSLWIQSGIMTFSRNLCNDLKYPSGFTRVSQYQDWIKSHIGSNPPEFVEFDTDIHHSFHLLPSSRLLKIL
ncbi:tryptase-like [Garra rufa]|uniref:tryptase-like n=1 Tax=Garra rufa TaxID=137080 RepID=UPI003CCEA13D